MTELDTLVGDEETSSSSSSSETQPYEGHITTSHTSSTSNSNSSRNNASQSFPNQLQRRVTRQQQQRQLDRALDLLEVTVQENKQLQAQLIQQMQRQQALTNQHYRALQQQQQQLLLLQADECNSHKRIPERPAEEKLPDAEKNMAKEESVTIDAETIPTRSFWTTNWNWVGASLIVATAAAVVGGGLVLYQVYTATAVEAAKAAAHATLAQRAATRARHEADLSIHAAHWAHGKAQTAGRAARVAMQAATFRHHHEHHRNFEPARDGLTSHPYHHHHHHPWGSMLDPTRWFIFEGSEFERANVCPHRHPDLHQGAAVNDEMGGLDRVVGGTCGTGTSSSNSSSSSSREGTCRRWITPQVVASSVQVGAAVALPVLLSLIRF